MSTKRKIGKQQLTTEFVVGLMFIAAMLVLGFFTIVLTKDSALFKNKFAELTIEFAEVGGIAKGDKVLLRGVQIGKVKNVGVSPTDLHRIILTAQIDPIYSKFGEGYIAEIRSSSALGGRHVYLEQGDLSKPQSLPLAGRPPVDPFYEAGRLAQDLRKTAADINEFVGKLNQKGSTLDKLTSSSDLYDEALASLKKVGDAGESVAAMKKDLGGVVDNFNKAGISLTKAGTDVSAAAKVLTEKVGPASESFKAAADNVNGLIADARKGKGTLGKLLTDEELANDLKSAVGEIKTALAGITGEKSSIGKLLRDEGALYDSIKTTVDDAGEVMAHIKDGKGTVGKLVMDETLYKDLKQTVRDVQGAINDFREQAPILTFGSFIFGSL